MKRMSLVDEIVNEPLGGAHSNREKTFDTVRNTIVKNYKTLASLTPKELVKQRMEKYFEMGVYQE